MSRSSRRSRRTARRTARRSRRAARRSIRTARRTARISRRTARRTARSAPGGSTSGGSSGRSSGGGSGRSSGGGSGRSSGGGSGGGSTVSRARRSVTGVLTGVVSRVRKAQTSIQQLKQAQSAKKLQATTPTPTVVPTPTPTPTPDVTKKILGQEFLIRKGKIEGETKHQRFRRSIRERDIRMSALRREEQEKGVIQLIKEKRYPGAIRQLFRAGGEKLVGLSGKIIGQDLTPKQKRYGGAIVGETMIFSGFTPATPSTVSIKEGLGIQSKVQFLSVQQAKRSGFVKTRTLFKVKTGAKTKFGGAEAITKTQELAKGFFKFVSGARGRIGTRAFEVGRGRFELVRPKGFKTIEKGVGKRLTETVSAAVSKGRLQVIGRKKLINFKTQAIQITGKKGKIGVGFAKTESTLGETLSGGIIFKKTKPDVGEGITSFRAIQQFRPGIKARGIGLQTIEKTVQQITQKEVPKFIVSAERGIVSGIIPSLKQKIAPTKTITTQEIKPITKYAPLQLKPISPKEKTKQFSSGKQKPVQLQKEITKQLPNQKDTTQQIEKQTQKFDQKLITLQKTQQIPKQRQRFAQSTFLKFYRKPPKFPVIPLKFKIGKAQKKPTGKFTVEVRRGGIFRPIGTFTNIRRATLVGRKRVAGTLAATFRIKGVRIGGLPKGFRRKVTKGGTLFIEKRKHRLSKRGEQIEIKAAKRRKKKVVRKKKK